MIALIEAQRARAEAQAALSRWFGQDAYRPIAQKLPTWECAAGLENLRDGLAAHPLLAAAEARSRRQAGVDIAEEKKKPGWALDLAYGYRDGFLPDGTPRSDFISLSVTVGLPFFSEKSPGPQTGCCAQRTQCAQVFADRSCRSPRRASSPPSMRAGWT